MNQIWQYLKTKWIKYLIETVTIILGILGAVALDNWNQDRKDAKLRIEYITRVQEDLLADRNEIMEQTEILDTRIKSVNELIPLFGQSIAPHDTLLSLITSLWYSGDFIEHDHTFQDLVNTGRFELLTPDELRQGLYELYAVYEELNSFEDHIKEDNRLYIYNPALQNYDIEKVFSTEGIESAIAFERFLANTTIKNGYSLFLSNANVLKMSYVTILDKLESLNSLIASQIE